MHEIKVGVAAVLGGAAMGLLLALLPIDGCAPTDPRHAFLSRVDVLEGRWRAWEAAYEAAGGDRARVLRLGWSKALSAGRPGASGQVRLDLVGGHVDAWVSGLDGEADLWIVDNRPGGTIRPEGSDRMVLAGRLTRDTYDVARLSADVDLRGVAVDLVAVTRPGTSPADELLLTGNTTLFHRLRDAARSQEPSRTWVSLLGPGPVAAQDAEADLAALVLKGDELFNDETFDGNGRTCATCHPPENNFTIDPAFVAALPADDPLFLAEYDSALAEGFEDPDAMRAAALILANADGFGDLGRYVLRGVPHTLGMLTSLTVPPTFNDGGAGPLERTGWSGDGAPGDGTLRDFATGAVTQHFPRTLGRVDGVDFRLPSDEELDAMEAYQLAQGRAEDPDLGTLTLRNTNAAAGLTLFQTTGRCGTCHANGGANLAAGLGGGNANFNTGVESLVSKLFTSPTIDGGFGTGALSSGGFGDGRFNTPPAIEAADTPPFFHDNSVDTLEEVVAFYTGPEFAASPAGARGAIVLDAAQQAQIVTFLRVMNALENIRSADQYASEAQTSTVTGATRHAVGLCLAEIEDAVIVLSKAKLHPDAVVELKAARKYLQNAQKSKAASTRNALVTSARTDLADARKLLVVE